MSAPIIKYDPFEHRWRSVETKWVLFAKKCVSSRLAGGTRIEYRFMIQIRQKGAGSPPPPAALVRGYNARTQGCDDVCWTSQSPSNSTITNIAFLDQIKVYQMRRQAKYKYRADMI